MDEREIAAEKLENIAASRRLVQHAETTYRGMKAEEDDMASERNRSVAVCTVFLGATAVMSETTEIPVSWQLPGYAIASVAFLKASIAQYYKFGYRRIASDYAKDMHKFNDEEFVGLPTPDWIKSDPAFKKFK